jgi:hypothetical protein
MSNPLNVEYRPDATLIPYVGNPRTHNAAQVASIAASIVEYGWTNPVLVDGENGVIAGHWSTFIIWAKNTFTMGRADYQRQYEPILYGWREGASHYWCGDRDQGDVWQINKPARNDLHPTMELVERAIRNSSRPRGPGPRPLRRLRDHPDCRGEVRAGGTADGARPGLRRRHSFPLAGADGQGRGAGERWGRVR